MIELLIWFFVILVSLGLIISFCNTLIDHKIKTELKINNRNLKLQNETLIAILKIYQNQDKSLNEKDNKTITK